MAFSRENLSTVSNAIKSGAVIKEWIYVNEASDDVTASSFFSDYRFVAGDQIKVISANGAIVSRYYVASVTSAGVVTLGTGVSDVVADGTTLTPADIITFDTTAEAFSYALADGVVGQKIIMVMIVDGGNDAVITPANLANGSTLTFADVNDTCTLLFVNDAWSVIANEGVAIA
jgi:hypothetical protein